MHDYLPAFFHTMWTHENMLEDEFVSKFSCHRGVTCMMRSLLPAALWLSVCRWPYT